MESLIKTKQSLITNVNNKYDICICIPSYNRYDKVHRLIKQFYDQSTKYTFCVILLNDGSDDSRYDTLKNEFNNLYYLKNYTPNGKVKHWFCYNQMWKKLKIIDYKFVLQMDDDFILSNEFLNTIIDIFYRERRKNSSIVAVAPHLWSFNKIQYNETWWKSCSFIDGIALIDKSIIESMNYEMKPPKNTVQKTGVPVGAWPQISNAIQRNNKKVYRTDFSLVYHDGNDDSKLHYDHRKNGKNGIYTQRYIGGKMISVILNVYKRPYMMEKQIEAILNQSITVLPEDIHIWYNASDVDFTLPKNKDIKTYNSSWNTKFWGRFTLPFILQTPYIAIFDDDIIPGEDWLKNCLETIEKKETTGILGGSGVILNQYGYHPFARKVGWNGSHENKAVQVDLVGHAWFFRKEWAKYIFYEEPYTWDNGEDIMFSYLAQKYGNINTFVPPHPENNTKLWSSDYNIGIRVGSDENSSWKLNNHIEIRNEICRYCIDKGWKTVNKIK